jgi:glycosyltransferase involved in cell wall biosynthesis
MNKFNNIDMSVIIPVYNVDKYLTVCLDSLMRQGDLRIEIVLVNDGSTDLSGKIVDEYAKKDDRIKVIHQENRGASVARNIGLDIAKGEYIAFLDSDDWVKEESLFSLYQKAVKHQADAVMGNMWVCHQDGSIDEPSKWIFSESTNESLSGKDGFIWLVKTSFYQPTSVRYIYNRKYLQKIHARFEEGIIHEDELWCPVVICQAERMVITDIEFYYYRQNEESVMHTTNLFHRLKSLFKVTDMLIHYSDRFDFSDEDKELKSCWYVNILRLYTMAFMLLSSVKDSSYILPEYHLDRFWRDCGQMIPESVQRCRDYYHIAEIGLKKYIYWRISDWVASVECQIKAGKKLMLIYNTINNEDLSLKIEDVPADWAITTDRRYFSQADVVVFHLPGLQQEVENDLDKPEGQIWASWYLESEGNHPLFNDPEIKDIFDLWISCRQDEDQEEHPLLRLCRNM